MNGKIFWLTDVPGGGTPRCYPCVGHCIYILSWSPYRYPNRPHRAELEHGLSKCGRMPCIFSECKRIGSLWGIALRPSSTHLRILLEKFLWGSFSSSPWSFGMGALCCPSTTRIVLQNRKHLNVHNTGTHQQTTLINYLMIRAMWSFIFVSETPALLSW